ncbi:fluoride efflux transporter FluC [Thalassiella azotivora]
MPTPGDDPVAPRGTPVDPDVTAADLADRHPADVLAVVAAGGALGALARWALDAVVPTGAGVPWATLLANVGGGALLGALLVLVATPAVATRPRLARYARPFAGVGVLGGFTTFSAFAEQLRGLLASGQAGTALLYLVLTLSAGLGATWAGARGTRLLLPSGTAP